MPPSVPGSFGAQLRALRETAGFTQDELATIAGLSVHAVSALERGERKRPQLDTVRALSAALDLDAEAREALLLSARAARGSASPGGADRHALPLPLTTLLGRDADVTRLLRWIADPLVRLITLTGPGGVGKTRLALEAARRTSADDGRVVFVPLAAIREPSLVARAIAEALGLQDHTAADLPRRVRAWCDGTPTLLVLDNCEQVLDAAPLVADLLASVAPLRVLATSREPLRLRGEREYPVGPLGVDVDDADASSPRALAPAVRLFLDRVRDVRPDFHLTPDLEPVVTAICRRLDALPLALEIAAPWLKVLTPEDLLRRLNEDALLTAIGPRDLPERQRTMNATVAWSYQLLDPAQQHVFRRMGVLPDRFPIDALAAVVAGRDGNIDPDEVLVAAAALVDRSLLRRVDSAVRSRPLYRMLETVRAYAALELAASGQREDAIDGLARYSVREGLLAADGLVGPLQSEWLHRVRDDLETHRTALTWLIEQGRANEAADVAFGLFFFWIIRGHATEGLTWFLRVSAMTSLAPLPAETEGRVLAGAGAMQFTQGELDKGRAQLARAITLVPRSGDISLGLAYMMGGHVEHAAGNSGGARELFGRCLAEAQRLESPWLVGNALSGLAWVALAAGDLEETDRLLGQVTPVLPGTGSWFELLPLYLKAVVAVRRNTSNNAMRLVRQSLVMIKDLHDTFAFVYSLVPLAMAAMAMGDDVWAARILGARDAVAEATGAAIVDQSVYALRETLEQEARERLGEQQWGRAYAAGRTASLDSLVKDIDARLKP